MKSITLADIAMFLHLAGKVVGPAGLRRLLAEVEDGRDIAEATHIPGIMTAAQLMHDTGSLPPMLIDGLLPDRSLFLLTGKPKTGKSFLALDIADTVSRGAPALNALPVNRPGPVLYLAMEDGKIEISRRLAQRGHQPQPTSNEQPVRSQPNPSPPKSVKSVKSVHRVPPSHLYFIAEAFSLTDSLAYARFREEAMALQPSLIVIDTAAEALDIRDWINRSEILTKIAPIRRLAREICTILLIAHNRKAEGDMGDEIAGSNALAGAVDGWISAHKVERRPDGNRRLHLRVEGRGGVGHELIAEMDHETLHFHLIPPEQVELDATAARESTYLGKRRERREHMLDIIRSLGDRATIAEVAVAMGIHYRSAWAILRELTALRQVEEADQQDRPTRLCARYPMQ